MVQQLSERAPEPSLDDEWLDRLDTIEGQPERRTTWQMLQDTFTGPARMARRTSVFMASTPGQIIAMMMVLTIALLAAGFSMSQSMGSRQRALDTLTTATEPMSHSAHLLYSSLSSADTVATSGFAQPGLLSREQLALYMASIDRAAVTAADIYEGAVVAESMDSGSGFGVAQEGEITGYVTEILRDLPVYTALMERAKVNQRLGNPVGVAYMTEASTVMREQMLRSADRLSSVTQQEVAAEVKRLSSPQWVPISGLIAALVLLAAAQWWLWRVFRRRLNRGFVAATLCIVVAIVWAGVSNFQSWQSGVVGFNQAARPWEQLTDARIQAQESRTDETLALLSRRSLTRSAQSFDLTYKNVSEALDAFEEVSGAPPELLSARRALDEWAAGHNELSAALVDGRFEAATDILNARPGSAEAFAQLDQDLQHLINESRENTRIYITASLDATRLVSTAVAVLTLLAVACIWVGIRRRLGEYF
ncbi:hypothetical protein CGLAU_10985 [Corynebacterium glaucum]|uniref:Four helix bundle sensory module for signal transduction n=1 Tax=Corynebacterium glaucum TaxID=187491 RepID=A0A1Q2HZ58_9CORY|nr:hypothetical protein [Corynebacterium glaucum]AQQ16131.1 hypothetical protein CGLAU_10985 [Corynebacterium glaucum]